MTDCERVVSLKRRVDELLAVLAFYGDPDNYEPQDNPVVISEGQARIATTEPLVMLDRGRKAREAG